MTEKQKTIAKAVCLEGIGLHTGNKAKVCFKPAEANSGIKFIRVDLPQSPAIAADITSVFIDREIPRCTSIGNGTAKIYTIEHLMSVLCGLGIDNLIVEIDSDELPGLDGSALGFLKVIKEAGLVEQNEPRKFIDLHEPIFVEKNGSAIFVAPAADFKISYTLDYNYPHLRSQFFSVDVRPETFESEIAPCRTFCLETEAEQLKKLGLGKGANYDNTLVIGKDGVKHNKLRFENECARHKVLDFVGDLYLLGIPLRGHVVAVKSGHALNLELLKKIAEQKKKYQPKPMREMPNFSGIKELNINDIVKVLPHRYPFLLVDRIYELEPGKRAIGIKNVTVNDNFFQGHFPTRPIMPGVLMVEAMAQTAGVTVLTDEMHRGQLALFLGADNVKFRKVVTPGDQLLMEVTVVKNKTRVAQIRAESKVNGEVVAEADLTFSFMEGNYLS